MGTSNNFALRLPASLKSEAEAVARADGSTLNQFIVTAVAEKLSALRTADYFRKRAGQADFETFDRVFAREHAAPTEPGDERP